MHFEELWEKCEQLHTQEAKGAPIDNLVEELLLKLNLYKAIDARTEL
jgi:hypothetical protein